MRRITLILSDLYLPAEVGQRGTRRGVSLPAPVELPNLDWLLRFASRVEPLEDWRSWLNLELRAFDLERATLAQCCALGMLPAPLASTAWIATPVHLEARIDHVRLADRGLLRLGADEREYWQREFALAFGPAYALHDAGERGFMLSGATAARAASVDPARLLDADIGRALPTGPAAGELRRLGTEVEMWLHGAAANDAREKRRERRVTALWLWGGGAGQISGDAIRKTAPDHALQFHGGDPFLRALAGGNLRPPPASWSALDAAVEYTVIEFAPMSGAADESLPTLDANWFAPIREALGDGRLQAVDLLANDRLFRIGPRPGWRIWRRRTNWLTQLATPPL